MFHLYKFVAKTLKFDDDLKPQTDFKIIFLEARRVSKTAMSANFLLFKQSLSLSILSTNRQDVSQAHEQEIANWMYCFLGTVSAAYTFTFVWISCQKRRIGISNTTE